MLPLWAEWHRQSENDAVRIIDRRSDPEWSVVVEASWTDGWDESLAWWEDRSGLHIYGQVIRSAVTQTNWRRSAGPQITTTAPGHFVQRPDPWWRQEKQSSTLCAKHVRDVNEQHELVQGSTRHRTYRRLWWVSFLKRLVILTFVPPHRANWLKLMSICGIEEDRVQRQRTKKNKQTEAWSTRTQLFEQVDRQAQKPRINQCANQPSVFPVFGDMSCECWIYPRIIPEKRSCRARMRGIKVSQDQLKQSKILFTNTDFRQQEKGSCDTFSLLWRQKSLGSLDERARFAIKGKQHEKPSVFGRHCSWHNQPRFLNGNVFFKRQKDKGQMQMKRILARNVSFLLLPPLDRLQFRGVVLSCAPKIKICTLKKNLLKKKCKRLRLSNLFERFTKTSLWKTSF